MKWIKSYVEYKESLVIDLGLDSIDLMESLNVWHDVLLDSINAEKLDFFDELKISENEYEPKGPGKMDLDYLCGDGDNDPDEKFVNSLSSLGLKKSPVEHTDSYQTFLNKSCKYMFIYRQESDFLENPVYILFQVFHKSGGDSPLGGWTPVELYRVNGDVNRFYNKLTSKTIEIIEGDQNYIYETSNGNDWILQNPDRENDVYKKILRKEELQDLLSTRNVKLVI